MTRLAYALVLAAACSNKDAAPQKPASAMPQSVAAPAAAGGTASIESTIRAFNAALEAGDAATIRAQFPPHAAYETYVSAACATGWDQMFDEWVGELTKNADIKAMHGMKSTFVGVENADTREAPGGANGDGCDFVKPVTFVKTSSTWKLEGEEHHLALTVIKLGDRYYAFDLPGH